MDATHTVAISLVYLGGLLLTILVLPGMVKDHDRSLVGSIIMATPAQRRGKFMLAIVILWPLTLAVFMVALLIVGIPVLAYDSVKELKRSTRR